MSALDVDADKLASSQTISRLTRLYREASETGERRLREVVRLQHEVDVLVGQMHAVRAELAAVRQTLRELDGTARADARHDGVW